MRINPIFLSLRKENTGESSSTNMLNGILDDLTQVDSFFLTVIELLNSFFF